MSSPGENPKRHSKLALLLRVLLKNPVEFRDRLLTIAEFQADRVRPAATSEPIEFETLVRQLGPYLEAHLDSFLNEGPLREIEDMVRQAQQQVLRNPAFETFHDADFALARICYAVCRARKPQVVVETGVGYGVTSAFLLQALATNGQGELWSIDLPPLGEGADDQAGCLVPATLRSRWHLLRGRSRNVLPQVLSQVPGVDVFLHDSLHTYRNMLWEFRTVWSKLNPRGILLSDDVAMNRAFEDFTAETTHSFAAASGEKGKHRDFGVLVKS